MSMCLQFDAEHIWDLMSLNIIKHVTLIHLIVRNYVAVVPFLSKESEELFADLNVTNVELSSVYFTNLI